MSYIKRKLYDYCLEFLDKRIAACNDAIQMAQASANEETKSSAGDKYETGRAMAQLEIEKNAAQLNEAQREKKILQSINIEVRAASIQNGSLVKTDRGNFFLAVSVGMVKIEGQSIGVVSSQSPIGKLLYGKTAGMTISFGPQTYKVLSFE